MRKREEGREVGWETKETVFRMDEDRRIRCTRGGAQGSGSSPGQLFLSLMMENRCEARKSRNWRNPKPKSFMQVVCVCPFDHF